MDKTEIFSIKEFLEFSPKERKMFISAPTKIMTIDGDKEMSADDSATYRMSMIKHYIPALFEHKYNKLQKIYIKNSKKKYLESRIKNLTTIFIKDLKDELKIVLKEKIETIKNKPKNLYQLVGAYSFAQLQACERKISEKTGHLFEEIACISPQCISPEEDFGVKVPGVDFLVYKENNEVLVCQMKTNKNTLTGSQAPRMKKELKIYEHPYFISAINTNAGWTTGKTETVGIKRRAGKDFWDIIDMPYDTIMKYVGEATLEIEKFVLKNIKL